MKLVINRDIPIGEPSKKDKRFFESCCVYIREGKILCQSVTLTPSSMDRLIKMVIHYSGEWYIDIVHYPDYMEIEQKT